jgi:hypothetical protein
MVGAARRADSSFRRERAVSPNPNPPAEAPGRGGGNFGIARGGCHAAQPLLMKSSGQYVNMWDCRLLRLLWTARAHGFDWQRDFFEHRLRHDESLQEKIQYVLENPVRAALVEDWWDWPFTILPEG